MGGSPLTKADALAIAEKLGAEIDNKKRTVLTIWRR